MGLPTNPHGVSTVEYEGTASVLSTADWEVALAGAANANSIDSASVIVRPMPRLRLTVVSMSVGTIVDSRCNISVESRVYIIYYREKLYPAMTVLSKIRTLSMSGRAATGTATHGHEHLWPGRTFDTRELDPLDRITIEARHVTVDWCKEGPTAVKRGSIVEGGGRAVDAGSTRSIQDRRGRSGPTDG